MSTSAQAIIRQSLAYEVKTLDYAYNALSPEEVQLAEDLGGATADIQGERQTF